MEKEIIKDEYLNSLIREISAFPPKGPTSGLMLRKINEEGLFEEAGMQFYYPDLYLGQLYSGLAVLAREMHIYLQEYPREDATIFNKIVSKVHGEELSVYGTGAFPGYKNEGLKVEIDKLPIGFIDLVSSGKFEPPILGDPSIIHEFTFKPGKMLAMRFFEEIGTHFKERVCGKGGVCRKWEKSTFLETTLAGLIIKNVFIAGVAATTFWYPFAAYLAVIIAKAGLEKYCKTDNLNFFNA